MKPLDFNALTTEQKFGMVMTGKVLKCDTQEEFDDNLDYILDLVKKRSLGAVWVTPHFDNYKETIELIKNTADYPILVFTDAECGFEKYKIGQHCAIGCAHSEEYAYAFGRVCGAEAKEAGYNVVCNPVLDTCRGLAACGSNVRTLGTDKHEVARLAAAIIRGMHDSGVLSVAKHYPSAKTAEALDTHMAEGVSLETEESILENNLFPYFELIKQGLLDGIMTGHTKIEKVDPDHPASLSKSVINLIKDRGFDGFTITDAMGMMGVVAKFGWVDSKGMAVEAGNDIVLDLRNPKLCYDAIKTCYEKGIISEKRLNEAAAKVIETQNKTLKMPGYSAPSDEEIKTFNNIDADSVYAVCDDGVSTAITKDGKHLFAVMVENGTAVSKTGKVELDTFSENWYRPAEITKYIQSKFKNSSIVAIDQFPPPSQVQNVLNNAVECEDVIFITFTDVQCFVGTERFTSRITDTMLSLSKTDKVSTILHFGNPYTAEDFPMHVKRLLFGCSSPKSINCAIDILAGDYEAKGTPMYDDVKLK